MAASVGVPSTLGRTGGCTQGAAGPNSSWSLARAPLAQTKVSTPMTPFIFLAIRLIDPLLIAPSVLPCLPIHAIILRLCLRKGKSLT
jgi:hypothetical protein